MSLPNVMVDVSQSSAKSTTQPKPYIRYVGMVQDMMEAEYFTTTTAANPGSSNHISERTPMMLLTIPTMHHYQNNSNHHRIPTRDTTYPSKRMRMDDISITTTSTFNANKEMSAEEIGRAHV